MKKPSRRDIVFAVIVLICGSIIGFATKSFFEQPPVDNFPYQRIDSLNTLIVNKDLIIARRDSLIAKQREREAYRDSLIVSGHKTLNLGYDKIKNFNDSTRARYIDSLLRAKRIRK